MQAAIVLPPREPQLVRDSPLWRRTGVLPQPADVSYNDPVGELVVAMMTMRPKARR